MKEERKGYHELFKSEKKKIVTDMYIKTYKLTDLYTSLHLPTYGWTHPSIVMRGDIYKNKAGYTAISCGRVGRGGNATVRN